MLLALCLGLLPIIPGRRKQRPSDTWGSIREEDLTADPRRTLTCAVRIAHRAILGQERGQHENQKDQEEKSAE
jgi:hypothetical protein